MWEPAGAAKAAAPWAARTPPNEHSYERVMHDSGQRRFLLELTKDEALRSRLLEQRLERFIGVIYRPDTELFSHYATASLPQQFDALIWFDETRAVVPLAPDRVNRSTVPVPLFPLMVLLLIIAIPLLHTPPPADVRNKVLAT